jgi:hypothetical protein
VWSAMPFCVVENSAPGAGHFRKAGDEFRREPHAVQIFYQLYGHGDTKVLLIPGMYDGLELSGIMGFWIWEFGWKEIDGSAASLIWQQSDVFGEIALVRVPICRML